MGCLWLRGLQPATPFPWAASGSGAAAPATPFPWAASPADKKVSNKNKWGLKLKLDEKAGPKPIIGLGATRDSQLLVMQVGQAGVGGGGGGVAGCWCCWHGSRELVMHMGTAVCWRCRWGGRIGALVLLLAWQPAAGGAARGRAVGHSSLLPSTAAGAPEPSSALPCVHARRRTAC